MSLVHEALQKAEREKLRRTGAPPAPAQKPSPRPPQPFSSTESRPAASVAAMSVSGTFAVDQSVDQTPSPVPRKKPAALLSMLIGCVAVVGIVAIVFLVSLAASAIRDSRQAVHVNSADKATPTANVAEPKEPSSAPLVAGDPAAPTAAQPPAVSGSPGFKLTGIMKDADGKYAAVLNGRVVYESYFVDGAIVKKIERDRITLDIKGRTEVVRLF